MIPRYRVWDKQTERMHIVSGIDFNDGLVSSVNIWHEGWPWVLEPDEIALMQSTGLKDKNGVGIFDGDIVITSKGAIGYVAYLQQEAGFVVVLKKSDYRLGHRNTGESYDVATAHEVIGNIYENSELLEEVKE